MNNTKKLLLFLIIQNGLLQAYAPINLFRPYDINWRMAEWAGKEVKGAKYRIGTNLEFGDTVKSRNTGSDKVSLLEIYQSSQSSIAMLLGAPAGSATEELANAIMPVTDDGIRGHFKLEGAKYRELAYTFYVNRDFEIETVPGVFRLTGYLPFRDMRLTNINFVDQTLSVNADDLLVKDQVTDDIANVVSDLGGLDIGDWTSSGISDVAVTLAWHNDFKQDTRKTLDKVRLTGKLGLTLPSGATKDEDKAFSLPMGNDGAIGMPCSGALDLFFKNKTRFGLEIEFLKQFDETRTRRLKTDINQTDFLLLNKGRARKDIGLTWKFNLYAQAEHFLGGLSTKIAFQSSRHDDDRLHVKSNDFGGEIVNTAQSLQDWVYHHLVFQANYDFMQHLKKSHFKPQLSFFYKLALEGRRVFIMDTFGAQFALNF